MPIHDYSTFAAPPAHPGTHLRQDYLPGLGLSPKDLALALGTDDQTVTQLLAGQLPVTTDLATGLAKLFRTSPEFWLNLQSQYEASHKAIGKTCPYASSAAD